MMILCGFLVVVVFHVDMGEIGYCKIANGMGTYSQWLAWQTRAYRDHVSCEMVQHIEMMMK